MNENNSPELKANYLHNNLTDPNNRARSGDINCQGHGSLEGGLKIKIADSQYLVGHVDR